MDHGPRQFHHGAVRHCSNPDASEADSGDPHSRPLQFAHAVGTLDRMLHIMEIELVQKVETVPVHVAAVTVRH
jgi:hypothetical protein